MQINRAATSPAVSVECHSTRQLSVVLTTVLNMDLGLSYHISVAQITTVKRIFKHCPSSGRSQRLPNFGWSGGVTHERKE